MSADYAISLGSAGPGGLYTGGWCNSNTRGFEPCITGANPVLPATRAQYARYHFLSPAAVFYPFFRGGGILLL